MATVIDSLIVTLGLDGSAYRRGVSDAQQDSAKITEAERKRAKTSQEASKAVAEGFTRARNELMGLAAAMLGASSIKGFFTSMVTGQATLGRLAQNLGMSARELDSWGAAAEQVGGTAQGIRQSFQSILGGFEAFKLGEQSPVVTAFRALGIAIADGNGKIRPMKDLMIDLAKALQGMPAQDQIRIAGMLGLDDGTLNLLRQGAAQVRATQEAMERTSAVSAESTMAAQRAQAQWATTKRELYGVGQQIFTALIPAMEGANARLLQFSGWVSSHREEIGSFLGAVGNGFNAIARAIGDVFGWFSKLGDKLVGTKVGDWLGEKVAQFLAYGGNTEARAALAANGKGPAPAARAAATVAPTGSAAASPAQFAELEKANGLPPGTLDRIWQIESGRGKNMVSGAGATGHFQFMPDTAKDFGMSREDTFDLGKSSAAAAKYLGQLLKRYGGDMMSAVSAYNWGQGNVDRQGLARAPAETADYWRKFVGLGGQQFSGSQVRSETNIQTLNIQTRATDAPGIARSIGDSLASNQRLQAASMGMR